MVWVESRDEQIYNAFVAKLKELKRVRVVRKAFPMVLIEGTLRAVKRSMDRFPVSVSRLIA